MEDDARLKPAWSEAWLKVQGRLPYDWECVYLGGVLPPNKEGFTKVLEETGIPGISRIAPNTFFGQSIPTRQFHFCAYAYILSRKGVKRIIEAIEGYKGIWTSADHILFNSLDKENVYVLNPLVAGASQDDDPAYVNSDFNDFSRIDKFDSDLWNNDERFSSNAISSLAELNILDAVNDAYSIPKVDVPHFVTLNTSEMPDTLYEIKWLEELFQQKISIERVSNSTDLKLYDNLIILLIKPKWKEQIEWLNAQSGIKFKIIHFSDEFENDPSFFYDLPEVTGVLRFYPRKDINSNEKVLTIPLGYHWQYNESIKPLKNRKYTWSFCGTDWKGRSEQMKQLLDIKPNKAEFFTQWNHPSQLREQDYLDLLSDTIFVPCPAGNNIETFRIYEALERGCIPLFIDIPPILLETKIPFLKTSTWIDVVNIMSHLNNNPEQLMQYQKVLMDGWAVYKNELKRKISEWLV
jgi:hypothetical protein